MSHYSSKILTFSLLLLAVTDLYPQPTKENDIFLWDDGKKNNTDYAYIVSGFTVTYENPATTDSTANYTYVWDFGDGNTSEMPSSVVHTYETMGFYQTCLTVLDEQKNVVDKKCQYVEILDPNLCDTNWEPVCGCDNQTYLNPCFAANYYGVYFWTPGPCETIDFSLAASFTATPTQLEVQFMNTSIGNYDSYSWTLGDGTNTEARNPNHHYKAAGQYEVCLTVSSLVTKQERKFCDTITICDTPPTPLQNPTTNTIVPQEEQLPK